MSRVVTFLRCAVVGYMVIFVLVFAYNCWAEPARISTEPTITPFIRASLWPAQAARGPMQKVIAGALGVASIAVVSFLVGYGAARGEMAWRR